MKATKETVLDECLTGIQSGCEIDSILHNYPEYAGELREMLDIAGELKNLPEPEISVAGAMRSLAAAINSSTESEKRQTPTKVTIFSRPVLLRVAAGIAIAFSLIWGTNLASANAVPGDWTYPLKLLTERIKFIVAINRENKAELRISFSEERLKEAVIKQMKEGHLDKDLLSKMMAESQEALKLAPELSDTGRTLIAARTAGTIEYQKQTLEQIRHKASPDDKEMAGQYIDMCERRGSWMRRALREAGKSSNGTPAPEVFRGCYDNCR